jgi:hypothetical protein
MRKEYDFSKGERGRFFRPNVQLNTPIYLELQLSEASVFGRAIQGVVANSVAPGL